MYATVPSTSSAARLEDTAIPGELNGYSGEVVQYGPLEYTEYNTQANGTKADNYASGGLTNPCP